MDFPKALVGIGAIVVGGTSTIVSPTFGALIALAGLYLLGTGIKE